MHEFSKKYFDLLNTDYKGINLTRINNYDEFYLKQIIDSIQPQFDSNCFKESLGAVDTVIDIGFGGGFPILPLAFKNPKKKFVGIETRAKKVNVVAEISTKLGLSNTSFIHSRIENVLIDIPTICTFKAVGKVQDFLGRIHTTQKIRVFFYKGPNFYELEKDQLEAVKRSWNIIEEAEISVQGTEKRYLIGFENKDVPCGTKAKNGSLVKLSELI